MALWAAPASACMSFELCGSDDWACHGTMATGMFLLLGGWALAPLICVLSSWAALWRPPRKVREWLVELGGISGGWLFMAIGIYGGAFVGTKTEIDAYPQAIMVVLWIILVCSYAALGRLLANLQGTR